MLPSRAVILWKSTGKQRIKVYDVTAAQWSHRGWTHCAGCICNDYRSANFEEQKQMLLSLAMDLVMVHGVPAEQVDEQYRQFGWYRQYAYKSPKSYPVCAVFG